MHLARRPTRQARPNRAHPAPSRRAHPAHPYPSRAPDSRIGRDRQPRPVRLLRLCDRRTDTLRSLRGPPKETIMFRIAARLTLAVALLGLAELGTGQARGQYPAQTMVYQTAVPGPPVVAPRQNVTRRRKLGAEDRHPRASHVAYVSPSAPVIRGETRFIQSAADRREPRDPAGADRRAADRPAGPRDPDPLLRPLPVLIGPPRRPRDGPGPAAITRRMTAPEPPRPSPRRHERGRSGRCGRRLRPG